MSSLDYEETVHKLAKLALDTACLSESVSMIIECCSQERTYVKYFSLLAQRFCTLSSIVRESFGHSFCRQLRLLHRLSIQKLRNISSLYAHLFACDSIS